MFKHKEVDLEEMIFGDDVKVIFTLENEQKKKRESGNYDWEARALHFNIEFTDIIFYKDIISFIEEKYNDKIELATIITEQGLEGYVFKFDYVDGLWLYGETRGYA